MKENRANYGKDQGRISLFEEANGIKTAIDIYRDGETFDVSFTQQSADAFNASNLHLTAAQFDAFLAAGNAVKNGDFS